MNNPSFSPAIWQKMFPADASQDGQNDIEIRDLLLVLWHRKWTVVVLVGCALLATYLYSSSLTPRYAASALVAMDQTNQNIVDLPPLVSDASERDPSAEMEVLVLTSRGLLQSVVEKLDLTSDPEFNPTLLPERSWWQWVETRRWPDWLPVADWLPSALSVAARPAGQEPGAALAGGDGADEQASLRVAIDILLKKLEVKVIPWTLAFSIRVETRDPEKSVRIANQIARSYITSQLEAKFEATREATLWMAERVADLRAKLEAAESEAKAFASSSPVASEEALAAETAQLKALRERLENVNDQRAALGDARTTAGDGGASGAGAADRTPAIPGVDPLLAQLAASAALLEKTIREKELSLASKSTSLVQLRQFEREADATRTLYEYFLGRMKEISAQEGIQRPDARILSQAVPRLGQVYPDTGLFMLISGLATVVAASIFIVAADLMNKSVRNVRDLQALGDKSVLGELPEAPIATRKALVPHMMAHPNSAFCEAVRGVRTSLYLASLDRTPQLVLVTSSLPGEGKTTTSVALAVQMAAGGKRVLLVDCDLRRTSLKRYFRKNPKLGLATVLSDEVALERAIQPDEAGGIDVLMAEKIAWSSGVFESERFLSLLAELRHRYDVVVIDSPPVLAVPDARVIAKSVDAVVFVVRWNKTLSLVARRGLELLEASAPPFIGLMLSRYDLKSMVGSLYGSYRAYYAVKKYYR